MSALEALSSGGKTTHLASHRQPSAPAQPIPPSRPRIIFFLEGMQPHRHHRSAAGLSCVPAAWTSLPAPVLPPETEETVDPAGRHRTGLARAGWHFWACSASY